MDHFVDYWMPFEIPAIGEEPVEQVWEQNMNLEISHKGNKYEGYYTGELVGGIPNGVGRFITDSWGSIWEGQWIDGRRHGFCRSIYNGGKLTFGQLDGGEW